RRQGKPLKATSADPPSPGAPTQGNQTACIDRPFSSRAQEGRIMLVDPAAHAKALTDLWRDVKGLAWRPDGKEIWFTATTRNEGRALYAVTAEGKTRLVARMPGSPWLYDISRDGRVLMDQYSVRHQIAAQPPGETRERDLSWLDGSTLDDLSPDGKRILFTEEYYGGGENSAVYVRSTDGSPAVRLGEGTAFSFSPDMKWALT